MAEFSPSAAAFSGFGLVRRRPGAVAAWAVALLVFGLAVWAAMFALGLPTAIHAAFLQAENPQDPAVALKAMQTLLPLQGGLALLELAFYPILISAVLRTFLDPRPRPFGGISFGADELRMLWLIIRLCIVFVVVEIVSLLAGMIAAMLIVMLGRIVHPPEIVFVLLHTVVLLAVFASLIYVMVRLSLATVVTAAEKRRGLRGSWRLTKGHFWSLFGAYVLTAFIVLACEALLLAAMLAVVGIGLFVTHTSLLDAFKVVLNPGSNPTLIVVVLVGNAAVVWFFAALFAVMFGPSVEAYRAFSALPKPTAS